MSNFNKKKPEIQILANNIRLMQNTDDLYNGITSNKAFLEISLQIKKCSLLESFTRKLNASGILLKKTEDLANMPFEDCNLVINQTPKDNSWHIHAETTNRSYIQIKAELTNQIKKFQNLKSAYTKKLSDEENMRYMNDYQLIRDEIKYLIDSAKLLLTNATHLLKILQSIITKAKEIKIFMENEKKNLQFLGKLNLKKIFYQENEIKSS